MATKARRQLVTTITRKRCSLEAVEILTPGAGSYRSNGKVAPRKRKAIRALVSETLRSAAVEFSRQSEPAFVIVCKHLKQDQRRIKRSHWRVVQLVVKPVCKL